MKLAIVKNSTDVKLIIFIQNSSVTTGAGLTGLAYDTSGLVCYYCRPGSAATQLALATQTVTGAHSDGGFVEVDAANMPGVYRLDLSDAIVATGVDSVAVMLKGAANMAPLTLEIQLTNMNFNDSVRGGMTALPNAAADAAGGLPISDAGGLDMDSKLANTNEVTAARMGALTDLIDGGRLDLLVDAIKAKTDNLPADPADDSDIDTQLATIAGYLDTEIAAILAAVDTEVAAIKAKTDNLPADPADDSDIDTQLATIAGYLDTEIAAILAAVDTEVAAIKAKTDNLPASPAAIGSEMNLADDAITSAKYDESTAHPITTAMQKAGSTIITGTVSHDNTPATTTVFYSDDITEATADHYNGRIVIFTSGALIGQATDITDYELDTGEGKFTVTALTEAPADDVTFVIV